MNLKSEIVYWTQGVHSMRTINKTINTKILLSGLILSLIFVATTKINYANASTNQNLWSAEVKKEKGFEVSNLVGEAGKQLKIDIRLPSRKYDKNSSMTFYGLPDKIILSSGVRKAKIWIVPVRKLKKLTLIAPSNFRGRFESAAILRRPNGKVIEGQRFIVDIVKQTVKKRPKKPIKVVSNIPENTIRDTSKVVSKRPKQKQKDEKKVAALSPKHQSPGATKEPPVKAKKVKRSKINLPVELVSSLLKKGKALLKDGNIIAARETFKFLASRGHSESAYIIGTTYDPEEFKNFDTQGIEPDLTKAKEWYSKAADMGNTKAAQIIQNRENAGL